MNMGWERTKGLEHEGGFLGGETTGGAGLGQEKTQFGSCCKLNGDIK